MLKALALSFENRLFCSSSLTANEISLKYFRNDITVGVTGTSPNYYTIDGTQQADVTLMPGFKGPYINLHGKNIYFKTEENKD